MTHRIAFMTFAVLKRPVGDALVQGFVDRIAGVYAAAEGSAGFFARSVRDMQTWEHSWGALVVPACCPPGLTLKQLAMTLSVWRDLESVAAFAYHGVHKEALSKRGDWFAQGSWPTYVAWWVADGHQPDWIDAASRLDHLHAHGPQPRAFTFRQPFDASGQPTRMQQKQVKSPAS
ncbi:MAG: DUF3291 domain-containing protein [Proteobacteria bacterium]|nr:DUF3291 domain-containing protein [Pseudomonadota bacterium]